MSDQEPQSEPLKATLKGGAGYEAPWITVQARTPDELKARAEALGNENVMEAVANAAELFRAAHAVAAGLGQAQPAQGATQTQSAPVQGGTEAPPAGQAKTCPHGVRVRRSGQGAKGPWVGYFCPLAKGDPNQCKPEWGD